MLAAKNIGTNTFINILAISVLILRKYCETETERFFKLKNIFFLT